jgi:hypothetical protein
MQYNGLNTLKSNTSKFKIFELPMCGLENSKLEKYKMGMPQGFNYISILNGKFQFASLVL